MTKKTNCQGFNIFYLFIKISQKHNKKDTIICLFRGFLERIFSRFLRFVSSFSRIENVFLTSSRACLHIIEYCDNGDITFVSNL